MCAQIDVLVAGGGAILSGLPQFLWSMVILGAFALAMLLRRPYTERYKNWGLIFIFGVTILSSIGYATREPSRLGRHCSWTCDGLTGHVCVCRGRSMLSDEFQGYDAVSSAIGYAVVSATLGYMLFWLVALVVGSLRRRFWYAEWGPDLVPRLCACMLLA